MAKKKGKNISQSLGKLEEIVEWFEEQEEIDIEEGLEKVKQGATLVRELRKKLKEVENEFQEVKEELEE